MAKCIKCNSKPTMKGRLTCEDCTTDDPFRDACALISENNFRIKQGGCPVESDKESFHRKKKKRKKRPKME